jgi:hypothetical protein
MLFTQKEQFEQELKRFAKGLWNKMQQNETDLKQL